MKITRPLTLFFFLCCTQQNLVAQQSIPNTLLWRISGNGLTKPSYLYGTMHLYDRRLFFFGDSVYNSIETTEGFAMELNPDDIMDSVFSKLGASDTSSLVRKMLDKRKYDSVAPKLEKRFGVPADKLTRKKIIEEREGWYYKIKHKDDMKSIVDLYLYDIAHKQGKWVGGIEDVDDQMGIKDELGKDINIADYLNNDDEKERKKFLETMVGAYANSDLNIIEGISSGTPGAYKDILLLRRNVKMARRMDSLSHIRSTFFAVGAAHLPGDSGVIEMLKGRGFAVEPVFSSKKIAPEDYTYTTVSIPWIKFTDPDSAYTVEMPGKISNMDMLGGELKFKVCADMVSNNFYMTTYTFASDRSPQEAQDAMYRSYTSNGFKKVSERKVTNAGVEGIEVISLKESIYYRVQIFVASNKYFLAIAGSEKKDNLSSKDVERFFGSFSINTKAEPKTTDWVDYSNEQKAFALSFPKKPSIDKLSQAEAGEHMDTYTYTSIDLKNGTYYMMVVSETQKGFVITADSLVFNNKLEAYKENNSEIKDIKYFIYEGNSAMSFTAYTKMNGFDFVSKMLIINRGNRNYSIACIAPKEKDDYPNITRFFRSFKLLPYKPADWANRSPLSGTFSTWSPAAIELVKADTTNMTLAELADAKEEAKSKLEYLSHDLNSATSYNVNVYPLSKYFWTENDSTALVGQLERYYSDTAGYYAKLNPGKFDSLIYRKEVMSGHTKGYEIMVTNASEVTTKKIRVYLHGDSVYHLFLTTHTSLINNDNNSRFLTDFRFANESLPTTAFTSKANLILADIQSEDSASRADAMDALGSSKFTSMDLPQLYAAFMKQYPADTNSYRSPNKLIAEAIKKIKDSSIIDYVKDNYSKVPAELKELKMNMLEILANEHSTKSFTLLKDLLLTDPPKKGMPYTLIYSIGDSLLLCKQLFPEVTALYNDSVMGSGIIRLAIELIDSSLATKDILSRNSEGILKTSGRQQAELLKDKDSYPDFNYYVISALGKLNDKRSNDALMDYLKVADMSAKQNAVIALLKNDQVVPAIQIQKLAADTGIRTEFYDSLKAMGKEKLFPKAFLSQQKFAEGYLFNYVKDDGEYEGKIILKPVAEKVITEKGQQGRYYLFKLTMSYDEENEDHLAICGPFDMNKEKPTVKKNGYEAIRIYYDDAFSAKEVDGLFEKFIKEKEDNKE